MSLYYILHVLLQFLLRSLIFLKRTRSLFLFLTFATSMNITEMQYIILIFINFKIEIMCHISLHHVLFVFRIRIHRLRISPAGSKRPNWINNGWIFCSMGMGM